MKQNILYSLLALLLYSCKSSNNDCSKVKTGTFFEKSPVDKSMIKIVRNDSIQIETNLKTGEIFRSKVEWISPCLFSLKVINSPQYNYADKIDSFTRNYLYQFNIIDVQDSYYIYSCKMDSAHKSITIIDTVFIDKN